MACQKKPCRECPFRKRAPAGWLGPWTPEDLIGQVMSEAGFACHMTVKEDGVSTGTLQCAGALICANKSAKGYRNPELAMDQNALRGHFDNEVMGAHEFLEHHNNAKVKSWKLDSRYNDAGEYAGEPEPSFEERMEGVKPR